MLSRSKNIKMRKKSIRVIKTRDLKSSWESLDTRHTSLKSIKLNKRVSSVSQPLLRRPSLVRSLVHPCPLKHSVSDLSFIRVRKESVVEQDSVLLDLATALTKPQLKLQTAHNFNPHRRKSYLTSPYNCEQPLRTRKLLHRRESSPSMTQLMKSNDKRLAR
jgi:hypothetical protein